MKTPTHDYSISKLVTALNTLISQSLAFFIFLFFFTSLSVSVLFVAL